MSILGAILPDLRLKGFYEHTVGLLALFTPDPSSNRQQSFELAALHRHDAVGGTPSCHSSGELQSGLIQASMRRELDNTKRELARSQSDIQKLDERCRALEKSLRDAQESLKAREAEVNRLQEERDRERLRAEQRRGRAERPEDRSRSSEFRRNRDILHGDDDAGSSGSGRRRASIGESNGTYGSLPKSEEGWAQVRSSETFLTKTDSWSGSQVIQALQDLNSEVLQFAASATDHSTFDQKSQSSASKEASHDVIFRLGPRMAQILSTTDHAQDPTFVQFALQGCVSKCIARSLSSFCMGFKSDDVMAQVYGHLYFAEPQPTSSRWRALTHRYLHTLYPALEHHAINELLETILRCISSILHVAGTVPPESGPMTLLEHLRALFGARVQRIARAVYKLAQVTREEIMSTNFEVMLVENGTAFDARKMTDAFANSGASRGAILCTTELGLGCTTRKCADPPAAGTPVTVERRLLMPPKVVLESAIEAIHSK